MKLDIDSMDKQQAKELNRRALLVMIGKTINHLATVAQYITGPSANECENSKKAIERAAELFIRNKDFISAEIAELIVILGVIEHNFSSAAFSTFEDLYKEAQKKQETIPDTGDRLRDVLDTLNLIRNGKRFAPGRKGKRSSFRVALADDWLSRYREQRKYFEKHDATADANAFIHQHWNTEKYGKEVKNPQIAKIVKERLQETGQNLD